MLKYHRDVWILGPSSTSCPGAFPQGFIRRVRRRWWGRKRLWMCSGGYRDPDGTTIDIRPQVASSVVGDAQRLPFKDGTFDFVVADPPYSEAEARDLYGTGYPSPLKLIQEGIRVLQPGGKLLFFHRLVPGHESRLPRNMILIALVGIAIIANWSSMRALAVFEKMGRLELGERIA